jgi:ABC-type multidrug transport system ATPase subunit
VLVGGKPMSGDTDPLKRKDRLVPQDLALYDELTAQDNLRFSARSTTFWRRAQERDDVGADTGRSSRIARESA